MTLRQRVAAFLALPVVSRGVIAVILLNAVLLGMETSPTLMARAGGLIVTLDTLCLTIFVIELTLKLFAQRLSFFRSGWNLFDAVIVGISLVPGAQSFSVLRALRILRLLRVISVTPSLRRVIEAFLRALPGMGSVFLLIGMIFYISAVMATKLFGSAFPDWFGDLGSSLYMLLQIMTLDSWSSGVVRPVMAVYPYAWLFFIPFVMLTTFTVLNLIVGLIVNSMQDAHGADAAAATETYRDEVLERLRAIEARLAAGEGAAGVARSGKDAKAPQEAHPES